MLDAVCMAMLVVVFAVLALFVVACDRIIGPDEAALADSAPPSPVHPRTEPSPESRAA